MNKINKGNSSNKARIRFQLGHTCGVTVFGILEQEGIERGCGEIFVGSNGWKVVSKNFPCVSMLNKAVFLWGRVQSEDDYNHILKDPNKEIYNSILETFKELGSFGNTLGTTPPKEGDKVLVRDSDDEEWNESIFIYELNSDQERKYICVCSYDIESYYAGTSDEYMGYAQMKSLQENTFKEIREGIPSEDLGTVFEVEFCLDGLGKNVQN